MRKKFVPHMMYCQMVFNVCVKFKWKHSIRFTVGWTINSLLCTTIFFSENRNCVLNVELYKKTKSWLNKEQTKILQIFPNLFSPHMLNICPLHISLHFCYLMWWTCDEIKGLFLIKQEKLNMKEEDPNSPLCSDCSVFIGPQLSVCTWSYDVSSTACLRLRS